MCFWQSDKDVLIKSYKIYASNSDQKETKLLPKKKVPKVFVWTLRMQFWQKNWETFATKWKENRTKSGAIYETLFFLKISYHLNDPLDTYIAFLTTSPNCLNCFPQRSASKYLNITFRSRKFSAIMFSVFIELICDRKAEKSLLKKWKNIVLILIFKNRFSFRESVFLWRFKIQYWLPCWIFYAQSPRRSRSNSEKN